MFGIVVSFYWYGKVKIISIMYSSHCQLKPIDVDIEKGHKDGQIMGFFKYFENPWSTFKQGFIKQIEVSLKLVFSHGHAWDGLKENGSVTLKMEAHVKAIGLM